MHVCGQTLVLVDNDATVSPVNQKLVRATLKYMFYHMPGDRTFCLRTYEHDISSDEEYTGEVNDLVCTADTIEFTPKDSNLCDTLCEVITRWKESDFACRDIVVFTDGLEGGALSHEKEELYYLAENSEYPVYIVMLNQENNADVRKGLSAVAVTSGGRFFETEFEGSDAEVDRQIAEKIFNSMDEYALSHWAAYETEEDSTGYGGTGAGDASVYDEVSEGTDGESEGMPERPDEIPVEDYMSEGVMQEGVIYEKDMSPTFLESGGALVLSAALITAGLLIAVFGSFVIMKRKRKDHAVIRPVPQVDEEFFEDYELGGIPTSDLAADTMLLSPGYCADESATRLLADVPVVTLTDREDGRRFRIVLGGAMTVGRGNCDVVITGDDALSKRHCELYGRDGKVYVRDLSSSNGTMVNNVKVKDERLSDGDGLTIGARTYTVEVT